MKSCNAVSLFFVPLAVGCLFLSACTSTEEEASSNGTSTRSQPSLNSAMASAQKNLALVYLEKADALLMQVDDAAAARETGLMIAHAYAYLGDAQQASRLIKSPPELPHDVPSYNEYLQYVSVLAALAEYEEIETCIEHLKTPESEALIRGYVVYYDALLRRDHLKQSLRDAADCIDASTDPYSIFALALGYHMDGNTVKGRKICLMSSAPEGRFAACAYMAATLGMAGDIGEASFYLEQAQSEYTQLANPTEIDSYTRMIYGRALAFAGRVEEATRIYTQLTSQADVVYLGSVIAERLRDDGHLDISNTIIRDTKAKVEKLQQHTDRTVYLYNCYGDFLITLGLYRDFDSVLKQTPDPLLKSNLLVGGAQALADEIVYRR